MMQPRLMVSEQELEDGDYPREIVRNAEAGPMGDYIALLSSVAAGIICSANVFSNWSGYQAAFGVMMLAACAGIAAFATYLLAARFAFRKVPAFRSPAWVYFAGGSSLVILSVLALVTGGLGATPSFALFFTLMSGVVTFAGGMVSS